MRAAISPGVVRQRPLRLLQPITYPNCQLCLGTSTTKALVWRIHDDIAGFTEPQSLPALPCKLEAVPALPTATRKLKSAKPSVEPNDELDDIDALET